MAIDVSNPGSILIAQSSELWSFNDRTEEFITKLPKSNSYIPAFYQLNESAIVLSDAKSFCLRLFDRTSKKMSVYSGMCSTAPIYRTGAKDEARFGYIRDMMLGKGDLLWDQLLVYDKSFRSIRSVSLSTQYVRTIYRGGDFDAGFSFCWEYLTNNILFGGRFDIKRLNLGVKSSVPETVAGVYDQSGVRDGPLDQSLFRATKRIIHFADYIYFAMSETTGIRVIDLKEQVVYSICRFSDNYEIAYLQEGDASSCRLTFPKALLIHNKFLYIAVSKIIGRVSGKFFIDKEFCKGFPFVETLLYLGGDCNNHYLDIISKFKSALRTF